jgi:hypothetical protein
VQGIEQRFLRDEAVPWREDVSAITATADEKLHARACECGGRFSLAAPPRCPHCRAVVLDSCFHFAFLP